MPSLRELDAHFVRHAPRQMTDEERALNPTFPPDRIVDCLDFWETFAGAHGVWFGCPLCFKANGNSMVGTHAVSIYFAGSPVPDRLGQNDRGQAVRWNASGTSLDDLVLTPSIQIIGGCNWHGFVGSSGVPPGNAA